MKHTFGGLTMNGCCKMNDDYGSGGDEMTDTWTIFGDPALQVMTDVPVAMTISHENQIFLGTSTFAVNCDAEGALIGLSMNNEFLASGFVSGGVANLSFPAMQTPDTMHLVVTAFNRLPYETDLAVIPNNGPYLIYNNTMVHDVTFNNNGLADYGEAVTLDLALNNIGVLPAQNVEVVLTSEDPFITLTDGLETYTEVPAGDTTAVENGFGFTLSTSIPDMHVIPFHYTATAGADSWAGSFSITAHAGNLKLISYIISDTEGNNNGKADPGETFDVNVSINNNGSASTSNVWGQLSINDPWLTLQSISAQAYGDLESGVTELRTYTFTADPNAPNGHIVPCAFLMTADLGLNTPTSFNIVIGQIPVAVIDLDMNLNSGPLVHASLMANNVFAEYKNVMPADISGYQTLFVCLGTNDKKHVLTSAEGQKLADFLAAGGKLYMEGGDTWYYDPKTAVHTMFKTNGVMDGGNDLSTLNGQTSTFTESLSFAFTGDNEFIDHIAPLSPAFTIFKNAMPLYISAVAYDQGTYKSIASAFEFGGLENAEFPSTRNEYMRRIIEFFGVLSTQLAANFIGSPASICEGGTVTFSNFTTGGATSYAWSFPGGVPETSTDPEPTVTYANPGLYDVTLIVTNGQYADTLVKPSYVWVEYCTGLGENSKAEISVSPNPAVSTINVGFGKLSGNATIKISDARGMVIVNRQIDLSAPFVYDVTSMPSGIYSLEVISQDFRKVTKFAVSH